jgi:hypothetical protein
MSSLSMPIRLLRTRAWLPTDVRHSQLRLTSANIPALAEARLKRTRQCPLSGSGSVAVAIAEPPFESRLVLLRKLIVALTTLPRAICLLLWFEIHSEWRRGKSTETSSHLTAGIASPAP